MTTLPEIRQQYPEYSDIGDRDLAGMLHRKFYSDMPRDEFDKKIGLTPKTPGQDLADTAAIAAAGFQKEARAGANPLNLIGGLARMSEGSVAAMPVQAAAFKALGIKPSSVGDWAERNAPSVDPALVWNAPQNQLARSAVKNVTGLDVATDLATPQAAAKAVDAEMTPTRRALASAAGIVGGSIPYLATGPIGPGLKLTGAMAAMGGVGDLVGGETGKTIGALAALPLALRGKPTGPKPSPAMTDDALSNLVKTKYKAAEDAGVVLKQEALKDLSANVNKTLAAEGLTEGLHPAALAAVKRLETEAGRGPMTLEGADKLRQVFNRYIGSAANKDDRRLMFMVRDELDSVMANPAAALMGDSAVANSAYREARDAYSRLALSRDIEAMVERAAAKAVNYSASGLENSIRREFVKLVANERRMKMIPPDVQAALRKVANGGAIDNLLRYVGKFTPKGVLTGALHGASIISNPALGVPLAGITMAARAGATAATKRNARLAAELARRGYALPPALRKYRNAGAVPGAIGARASEQ